MSDERVRLFVALELPDEVRAALVEWRAEAVGGVDGIRLIARDYLHVTLCFLGWRSADEVGAIAAACGVLAGRTTGELALGEGIWLPRRRPRVLAVSVEDPDGRLAEAQKELSATLAAGGWYRPEQRPFLAHVTVARIGRTGRPSARSLAGPPRLGFRAPRLTLYRSRLSPAGARYEPLASVVL